MKTTSALKGRHRIKSQTKFLLSQNPDHETQKYLHQKSEELLTISSLARLRIPMSEPEKNFPENAESLNYFHVNP